MNRLRALWLCLGVALVITLALPVRADIPSLGSSGTLGALNATVSVYCANGQSTADIYVPAGLVGTVTAAVSATGSSPWLPPMWSQAGNNQNYSASMSSFPGHLYVNLASTPYVNVTVSAYTSGSSVATVRCTAAVAQGPPAGPQATPSGTVSVSPTTGSASGTYEGPWPYNLKLLIPTGGGGGGGAPNDCNQANTPAPSGTPYGYGCLQPAGTPSPQTGSLGVTSELQAGSLWLTSNIIGEPSGDIYLCPEYTTSSSLCGTGGAYVDYNSSFGYEISANGLLQNDVSAGGFCYIEDGIDCSTPGGITLTQTGDSGITLTDTDDQIFVSETAEFGGIELDQSGNEGDIEINAAGTDSNLQMGSDSTTTLFAKANMGNVNQVFAQSVPVCQDQSTSIVSCVPFALVNESWCSGTSTCTFNFPTYASVCEGGVNAQGFLVVSADSGATITPPSGWNVLGSVVGTNTQIVAYASNGIAGSCPSSYSVSGSDGTAGWAASFRTSHNMTFTGLDVDATATPGPPTAGNVFQMPSVTPTQGYTMIMFAASAESNVTSNYLPGYIIGGTGAAVENSSYPGYPAVANVRDLYIGIELRPGGLGNEGGGGGFHQPIPGIVFAAPDGVLSGSTISELTMSLY